MKVCPDKLVLASTFPLLVHKKLDVGFGLPGLVLLNAQGQAVVSIAEHARFSNLSLAPGMPFQEGSNYFFYFGIGKPALEVFLYCLGGKLKVS